MKIRFQGHISEIIHDQACSGLDLASRLFPETQGEILCMAIDGHHENLHNTIRKNARIVDFYTVRDSSGFNSLAATNIGVLLCAVEKRFPGVTVAVEHSLGNGYYCEPSELPVDMPAFLAAVQEEMNILIRADVPIHSRFMSVETLSGYNHGRFKFVQQLRNKKLRISFLCDQVHWFNAPLAPSTSYIKKFTLTAYDKGFVIQFPNRLYPDSIPPLHKSNRIFEVFQESKQRAQLLNIRFVDHLNHLVETDKFYEAIQIYEALHEKKIASIADAIVAARGVKFIFIAGPSSSGKTSFMKRLAIQLRINGVSFKAISLDDYFIDREKLPYDAEGKQDFEDFDALDHELLKNHLKTLLAGRGVKLSHYDFPTGTQQRETEETFLGDNELLIMEGIHGLNPRLTTGIPGDSIFRIYISALTSLNYNIYNRISTSDTRLLRRMIRDDKYRGHSAENTLLRWPSVRAGEEKWIFPYQEQADAIFNSALEYEWSVFRPFLSGKLRRVPLFSPVKPQAQRLLNLLELFLPVPVKHIPPTSIIREFLGGSSFIY